MADYYCMQMARSLKFILSNNEDTAIDYTERVLGQEQELSRVMVYHQLTMSSR